MAEPTDLIHTIGYPEDVDVIADLIYEHFNTRVHICGARIAFQTAVVSSRTSTREVIALPAPSQEHRERLNAMGWSVTEVTDYDELKQRVIGWINEDIKGFWPSLTDRSYFKLSPREAVTKLTPLQVLSMKLSRDRLARVQVVRANDAEAAPSDTTDRNLLESFDRLGIQLTADQIRRAVRLTVVDGLGDQLQKAVTDRVPIRCVDDPVLENLAGEAMSASPLESPEDLMKRYTALVACAVAHRLIRRDNPATARLARFLFDLYLLDQRDDVELDQRLWLTREQLRALVDPESALRVARESAKGTSGDNWSIQTSGGFLDRIGWADLLAGMTVWMERGGEPVLQAPDLGLLTRSIMDAILRNRGPDLDDWWLGEQLADTLAMLGKAIPADSDFLDAVSGELIDRVSPLAALAFLGGTVRHANLTNRTDLATAASAAALAALAEVDPGPARYAQILTEAGNTFRYLQRWNEALKLYDMAESVIGFEPDGLAERERVLERNRALVFRDTHRYREAEAILRRHVEAAPDDRGALESLALLHARVGRREEAVALIDGRLARPGLTPFDSGRLHIIRAQLRVGLGLHDAAAEDCVSAMGALGRDLSQRLQIDAAALLTEPTGEQLADFVSACEQHVVEILDGPALDHPVQAFSAALSAALRRLRAGRISEAGELIGRMTEWTGTLNWSAPWQLNLAVGWHLLETGAPGAFAQLVKAIGGIDRRLSMATESAYAIGALSDFFIDDLQRLSVRAGVAAVTAGESGPGELIPVVDFAVGRDLVARAEANSHIETARDGLAAIEALGGWRCAASADIVAFIDDTPTLHLLIQPAVGAARLVDTSIPVAGLAAGVRALRAFDFANPRDPGRLDARLTPWWEAMSTLASVIRRELVGAGELVLMPGRVLVGTPLHAAGWPDRPLIADRPVSVTPNHRLLTARRTDDPTRPDAAPFGLIAVPKVSDTAAFTGRLDAFVEEFRRRAPRALILSDTEADQLTTLDVMGRARAVLLLCHGVHGGPRLGPSICVSKDGLLPPAQLDVVADPDLSAFQLSWNDITTVSRSPDLLVTVACSSGRTVMSSGGARLGLEQGTLANATRFVIAPLWPVGQHASLLWVEHFVNSMEQDPHGAVVPPHNVPDLHRSATLALAESHPHPFHWAPFTLATALRGGTP
jgi:tetratricopeptide (TPR) repeat protein